MQTITKTIHISLPESLIESAKTQAQKGQFSNMSEYVRSLIREDVVRREEQKLQELLLDGARSERGPEIGSAEWQAFRKRLSEETRKDQAQITRHETLALFYQTEALEDTHYIYSYIVQDIPFAAEGFLNALEDAATLLSQSPEIG